MPDPPILATEQSRGRLLLLDPAEQDWSRPEAVLWSWNAEEDPSFAAAVPAPERAERAWRNPSEAKARTVRGHRYVLTTASGGLAAAVHAASGAAHWMADTGAHNLHSIEVLPGGAVAVAASTEGWVRLYPDALAGAPRGGRPEPGGAGPAEAALAGAHGLHYDRARRLLWALGTYELVAYRVPGPQRLEPVRRHPLPDTGGHDLAPVRTAADRLWVTTTAHVAQFSPGRGTFVPYRGAERIDRAFAKAVGDAPGSGRLLTVTPEDGHPVPWASTGVDLADRDGRRAERRVRPGAAFYKARWWAPR